MFNRRAVKTSRFSLYWFLGLAGIAVLALYLAPSALAATYTAGSGYCQNNDNVDNPGQVSWDFVANPTSSNPSTLVATNDFPIGENLTSGECFWSDFATSGTTVHCATAPCASLTVEHTVIYNSGSGGSNPAGKAEVITPFGTYSQTFHADTTPSTQWTYGPSSTSWNIPVGTDLSTIQVESFAGAGNPDTSSTEIDILTVSISYDPTL